MIERLLPHTHRAKDKLERSILKTITYRLIIIILDFFFIYFFTGQVKIAIGFMVISNFYTTIAYYLHERYWNNIKWGRIIYKKNTKNEDHQEII